MDRWLWTLSATRVLSRGEGDCNVVRSRHGSLQADFLSWQSRFLKRLQALARGEKKACGGKCKKGTCKKHKGAQEQPEPGSEGVPQQSSEARKPVNGVALMWRLYVDFTLHTGLNMLPSSPQCD